MPMNGPTTLKLSVSDVQGLEPLQEEYGAFKSALEKVLQLPIQFVPVESFVEAAPALLFNKVDLVIAGPSEYVLLRARAKAVPIVSITRPGYRSVIAVRKDSTIQSLGQLKGKTIAMRAEGSTAGHLGPIKMLLETGLKPITDYNVKMLGDRGMVALKEGKVDACGLSTFYYQRFLQSEGVSAQDFPLVTSGLSLPSDVVVANSQLPSELRAKVQSRMLAHGEQLIQAILVSPSLADKFKGAKIVTVRDQDYDMIREVYAATGLMELIQCTI